MEDVIAIFYQFGKCYCFMKCSRCENHNSCMLQWLVGRCYLPSGRWNSHILQHLFGRCYLPSGRWNSHCRVDVYVRWYINWQMNSQGSVQFSLNSEVLNRTSSHICGRWNLPIFLLRDGLLTLINNASLIALLRFWSSLPTVLK